MIRNALRLVRKFSAQAVTEKLPDNKLFGPTFKEWAYLQTGYCKYGLLGDDCIHETEQVEEALRRLTLKEPEIMDQRVFRIVRAGYLSLRNEILPKEQWIKLEDDVHYLQPYIDEVEAEEKEKKEWDSIDED